MSWSSATLVKCPLGLFMRSFLRLKVGNLHLGFRGVELSVLTEMIIFAQLRAARRRQRRPRPARQRDARGNVSPL